MKVESERIEDESSGIFFIVVAFSAISELEFERRKNLTKQATKNMTDNHPTELVLNDKYVIVAKEKLEETLRSDRYKSVLYALDEGNNVEYVNIQYFYLSYFFHCTVEFAPSFR